MRIDNLVGKEGVFTSYDDAVWGEKYAGKKCTVIEATINYNDEVGGELKVVFEDSQELTMGLNEFELA